MTRPYSNFLIPQPTALSHAGAAAPTLLDQAHGRDTLATATGPASLSTAADRVTRRERQSIADVYAKGRSKSEVARLHGRSFDTIKRVLADAGVPTRYEKPGPKSDQRHGP